MRHLPYGLGIVIPCAIISTIGYGVYFTFLTKFDKIYTQVWVFGYVMVWSSYIMAILKSPGYTKPRKLQKFDVWCTKCKAPKPERAHHCKQCGRCVLKMDHHCPWTANCVGHENLAHFYRFLFWVVAEGSFSFYLEVSFVREVWNEPAYLYSKVVLVFIVFELLLTIIIVVSVGLLLFRVIYNTANGQTQIEAWEQDRVNTMARRKLCGIESFPFDVSFHSNFHTAFGPFYSWLWPLGRAPGSGDQFPKLFKTEKRWPPATEYDNQHTRYDFYRPENYINADGEQLEFFGVDAETDIKNDAEDIPLAALPNI